VRVKLGFGSLCLLLLTSAIALPQIRAANAPKVGEAVVVSTDKIEDKPTRGSAREGAPIGLDPLEAQNANAAKNGAMFAIDGACLTPDDEPIAGARVRLFVARGPAHVPEQVAEAISDGRGAFRFANLEVPVFGQNTWHTYGVVATAPGRASSINQVFTPEHRTLRMVLGTPGTLSGRVTSEDGAPVSGATVDFGGGINDHVVPGVRSATTDSKGRFSISDLAAFEAPSSTQCFFQVQHLQFGKQASEFNRVPSTVDVVLKAPSIVEGLVVDAVTGKPAVRVPVAAQGVSRGKHNGWGEVLTDAQGRYKMLLMPDSYNIWATMPGRTVVALDSYTVVKGKNPPADLKLIEGGFIAGRVLGPDGNPAKQLKDGTIHIALYGPSRPRSGAAVELARVNSDGTYRIRVPPGENYPYLYEGITNDRREPFKSPPIVVKPGETTTLDFNVR
jgi:hypothetical protein